MDAVGGSLFVQSANKNNNISNGISDDIWLIFYSHINPGIIQMEASSALLVKIGKQISAKGLASSQKCHESLRRSTGEASKHIKSHK